MHKTKVYFNELKCLLNTRNHIDFDIKIEYIHDFQIVLQLIRQWCQTLFSRHNSQDVSLCEEHFMKQCELYCEDCDVPICILCITSQRHTAHYVVHLQDIFDVQKDNLNRDLQFTRA